MFGLVAGGLRARVADRSARSDATAPGADENAGKVAGTGSEESAFGQRRSRAARAVLASLLRRLSV